MRKRRPPCCHCSLGIIVGIFLALAPPTSSAADSEDVATPAHEHRLRRGRRPAHGHRHSRGHRRPPVWGNLSNPSYKDYLDNYEFHRIRGHQELVKQFMRSIGRDRAGPPSDWKNKPKVDQDYLQAAFDKAGLPLELSRDGIVEMVGDSLIAREL